MHGSRGRTRHRALPTQTEAYRQSRRRRRAHSEVRISEGLGPQRAEGDRLIAFQVGQCKVCSRQTRADTGNYLIGTTRRSVRRKRWSSRYAAGVRRRSRGRHTARKHSARTASRSSEGHCDAADRIAGLRDSGLKLRSESRVDGCALRRASSRADCIVDFNGADVDPSVDSREAALVGRRWGNKGRIARIDCRAARQKQMRLRWTTTAANDLQHSATHPARQSGCCF